MCDEIPNDTSIGSIVMMDDVTHLHGRTEIVFTEAIQFEDIYLNESEEYWLEEELDAFSKMYDLVDSEYTSTHGVPIQNLNESQSATERTAPTDVLVGQKSLVEASDNSGDVPMVDVLSAPEVAIVHPSTDEMMDWKNVTTSETVEGSLTESSSCVQSTGSVVGKTNETK